MLRKPRRRSTNRKICEMTCLLPPCLYVLRDREAGAISAIGVAQQMIRFLIADNLLGLRIEIQRAAEPVRHVGQMHQGCRNMAFLYRRAKLVLVPASHAVDEVREMAFFAVAAGAGLFSLAEKAGVGLVLVDREISFRPVVDVADGSWFPRCRPERCTSRRRLRGCRQTGRRKTALAELTNLGLMIGDPVAHFELQHLPLAVGGIELETAIQNVRCLLVVVEHYVSAHCGHFGRELDAQAPTRGVHLVDALVPDVAVTGVPEPVPIVVEAIAGESAIWCWAEP